MEREARRDRSVIALLEIGAGGPVILAIGLFPMFPRWWLIGFFALLVAPLGIRALRAR